VTLTIQKSPKSIVLHKKIDVINAGETKTVTFTNIDINGLFGLPTTVKVDIEPVPAKRQRRTTRPSTKSSSPSAVRRLVRCTSRPRSGSRRGLRRCSGRAARGALAWWKLRAVRASQLVLLGGGKQDLVDFAVSLQGRIDDLHRAVDEIAAGLSRVDRRVDTAVSKTSLVRYDAYEGAGGHQSASIALLDAGRSGVV